MDGMEWDIPGNANKKIGLQTQGQRNLGIGDGVAGLGQVDRQNLLAAQLALDCT